MSRAIDFYFSMISPWAYMGDRLFNDIVARHDVAVTHKPVQLPRVFEQTGGLPLPKRHPARQTYRWYELQRWREARGIELNLKPKHWPFDFALADRLVIAAQAAGHDPAPLVSRGLRAIWVEDADLADALTLGRIAADAGLDGAALLAEAATDAVEDRYARNTADAVAAGAFGSPCIVMDGEVFWGQDRYELFEAALASGRTAYRVPA